MKIGFLSKVPVVIDIVGVLFFAIVLAVDLTGNGPLAAIVFDATMLFFFAGQAVSEFKVVGEVWQFLVKEGTTFISGVVLGVCFAFLVAIARGATETLLSLAVLVLGTFLAVVSGRRLRSAFRRVPGETGRSSERR